MAITAETRKDIIELVVTALNEAPGTTLLNELVGIVNGGGTLNDVAAKIAASDAFKAKYPALQTAEEFADEWLSNLIPEASAEALSEAKTIVVGLVNANTSAADMLIQAQTFLSATAETDASFGTSAANFNNKTEVATHHTVTLEQADPSAAAIQGVTSDDATVETAKSDLGGGAASGGATFTATTGVDKVVGTAKGDVINAAAGTFNAGDTIDGGDGIDTLNVTWTGTGPAQSASTLKNVEILNLTASPNPASLALTGVTGITDINNVSSANGATLTVSGVGNAVNSTLTGGQAATTIGYTTAVTASTATSDKSTLTLAGTNLGASYTATGIEELTINSTKSANTLSSIGVSGATKVTVTGDQALTVDGTVGGSALTSVDASAFTGKTLSMTAGAGVGKTAKAGVAITLPTADTVTSTVTAGGNKDTITLGAGGATVTAGGGDDTITSGAGTNTIMGGAGNDAIKLSGTKDTLRYAEAGATNADTIEGFGTSTVIAVNLGSDKTATKAADANSAFGVVQSGATSVSIGNVDGKGTGTAIAFQTVTATATTTSNPVAATSNVLALNGAFTDGTADGVVTALGNSATSAIATAAGSKFLVVTYSVGNIAQVWAYNGDDDADTDIDDSELALVATLSGVTQNSMSAANFATYKTVSTPGGTVSNTGQSITVSTPKTLIQADANANGQFLTNANDTISVNTGMLPTNTATATMGLTVIDPSGSDEDSLTAQVLSATWDAGTLLSNIETVNLEYLTTDTALAMTSVLPGTDTLNVSGLVDVSGITNIVSGTAFGLGSTYTKSLSVTPTAGDDITLNVNGTHMAATSAAAGTANFVTTTLIDDLTINVNANSAVKLDTNTTNQAEIIVKGSKNLTIYDVNAGFDAAKITTTDLGFTGKLTLAVTNAAATLDFVGTGTAVGVDAVDISIAGGAPVITLPAVTGGGSFTLSHSPTATAAAGNISVTQSGSAVNDTVTVALGSSSSGTGTITASNTETLNVSVAATSNTIGNVTIAQSASSQTVNFTGGTGDGAQIGTVNADKVSTAGMSGTVSIGNLANSIGTTTFTGGSGKTTIAGSTQAVTITTGKGDDDITASANDDVISAGAGADTITGGTGDDLITGGAGADTFEFGTDGSVAGTDLDQIVDFAKGSDKIGFGAAAVLLAAETDGTTATTDVDTSTGGKVTFAAADDTYAEKVTAIQADTQLDAVNSVAFFEDQGSTFVYYAGAATGNADDQIIQLSGVSGLTTITVTAGDITIA